MSNVPLVRLTRELRFGLHELEAPAASGGANGFAGNPALRDIAPFLTLSATLSGVVEASTGMLLNIKNVDRILRERGVPYLRRAYYETRKTAPGVMPELFAELRDCFSPHTLETLVLTLSPYLRFSSHKEHPHMVRLSQRFEFSAAHRLHSQYLSDEENREIFGRCNNPSGHGHNYELEVCVTGEVDAVTGQVISIDLLQQLVNRHILDVFDHKHLNVDCEEFKALNPTVENIAAVIYAKLRVVIPSPARLDRVRVWETPKTVCEIAES